MKKEELYSLLIGKGYIHEKDSEYNKDIFTNKEVIVDGNKTKIEILADNYTVMIRWWYGINNKVSTSLYTSNVNEDVLQRAVQNLIDNNKPVRTSFNAWTDGSCDNLNPRRPGGAAYIIFDDTGNEIKRNSKGFVGTSNNRMEILAIMSVVNSLPNNSNVTIHSDSQYSINVLSGKWKASENLDQINRYNQICLTRNIKVDFVWVKGHDGNPYNELCDALARKEYNNMRKSSSNPKQNKSKPKSKPKKKVKGKASRWTNELEEQYYSCITTKGRKKCPKNKNRKG